jgi:hypothetical protein
MRLAFAINVLILAPIALPTLLRLADTAQGRFDESAGWRVLVGSLWTAILLLSLVGLWRPERVAAVLVAQVIYKSLWLLVYALPRLASGRAHKLPPGITACFVVIVAAWPFLIPWRALFAP